MCDFIPLYKENSSKHAAVMPSPNHRPITVTLKETFNIFTWNYQVKLIMRFRTFAFEDMT
jgi:hypothetical protein